MKILVRKNEISLLKKKLESELEFINDEIEKMEKTKDSFIWQGKAFDTFITKYDEKLMKLKYKIKSLEIFIKFLDLVVVNYDYATELMKNEFKSIKDMKYERKGI